jgi:hypothetical protein
MRKIALFSPEGVRRDVVAGYEGPWLRRGYTVQEPAQESAQEPDFAAPLPSEPVESSDQVIDPDEQD